MKLAFGEYAPDLPAHLSPGVSTASNLYPGANGYRPVGTFAALGSALPSACLGAASFSSEAGRSVIIAGTATSLYTATQSGWTLIGTGYSVSSNGRWRFAQFGDFAIATNGADRPLKINLATDVVSALGGSPPTMQAIATVYNFLVGTVIGGKVNRVAWSGENNSEWWTFAQRKSDYQDFADGGPVTGLIGGEIGLVLQRNAVRRMAYVGGNILFRFDKISSNDGCTTVHSVAQHGELAFWYSDNGFKMWDGAQIRSIGFERVDTTFAAENATDGFSRMSCAVDGQRSTVVWSTGAKLWSYNWKLDKWGAPIVLAVEIVTSGVSRGPSLDEQDTVVGATDDNVDGVGLVTLDDARFRGGDPRFYLVVAGVIGTLSGVNMAASIAGRRVEMIQGRDARLRRLRPMSDVVAGVTVTLKTWQRLGDAPRTGVFTALNASGEMPVRARGRFVEVGLAIAAGQTWTYIQGADATLEAGGMR